MAFVMTACPGGGSTAERRIETDDAQSQLRADYLSWDREEAETRYETDDFEKGEPIARLLIPRLRVDVIVLEDIESEVLVKGPGHYPGSALPGDRQGNVAIADQGTDGGDPFVRLNELRHGDEIILEAPFASFHYEVTDSFDGHGNPWVKDALDYKPLLPTGEGVLTLTTDAPQGVDARLLVRATLVQRRERS